MVPVVMLRIAPGHACLDVCASPGSKTTQKPECLAVGDGRTAVSSVIAAVGGGGDGFVVANNLDPRRARVLAKRCCDAAPASCARLLVCSHQAQWMPPPARARARGLSGGSRRRSRAGPRDACGVQNYSKSRRSLSFLALHALE